MSITSAASYPAMGPLSAWGLRLTAVAYLTLILLLPLATVFADALRGPAPETTTVTERGVNAAGIEVERTVVREIQRPYRLSEGFAEFFRQIGRPTAVSALMLSLWTATVMTVINAAAGMLTAYVLVRYRFWGRAFLNTLIDLPFAIPTLVTGVMLVILYGPHAVLGQIFVERIGFEILFAPPGIILALMFVSFPLVVRSIQPVLEEIESDQEEAARSLGASDWQTFVKVLLPAILPAVLTGALLSFSRALGEFGAVVIVAGNIPMFSQTAAVYVLGELESENRVGASAMSAVLLVVSFALVLVVDWIQRRRGGSRNA